MQTTPTLRLPAGLAAQAIGMPGQFFVQQNPAARQQGLQMATIQPQVMLITLQGRMQLQQIQTPSGPKLAAAPMGQTLIPALGPGQILTTPAASSIMQLGGLQFQQPPGTVIVSMSAGVPGSTGTIFTATSQAHTLQVTPVSSVGAPAGQVIWSTPISVASSQAPTVIQATGQQDPATLPTSSQPPSLSSPVKKKAKKDRRREENFPSKGQQGTVDLGALKKDVGLDFGEDFVFGAPPRRRNLASDPTRTTLFEDTTLPRGWYRKVSQRKSGASAGRYDVFIIGPSGKRFRSRNEIKTFLEKTGETTLNPDDFDFSTHGRNNPKKMHLVPSCSPHPPTSPSLGYHTEPSSAPSHSFQPLSPDSSACNPQDGQVKLEPLDFIEKSSLA